MDLAKRERRIDLQSMTSEQIELFVQNLNKEIESARGEFKSKLERILTPIGIKFAIVLKLSENQQEIDEFLSMFRSDKALESDSQMKKNEEILKRKVLPKKRGRKPKNVKS